MGNKFNIKKLVNERGLSLVEVLVSIVLLALLLTTFLTVFIQSAKMNKTSETIIDATYVAQTEMEKIYANSLTSTYNRREDAIKDLSYGKKDEIVDEFGVAWIVFEKETVDSNYYIKLKLQKEMKLANMNRLVIQVFKGLGETPRAQMETVLLWEADSK